MLGTRTPWTGLETLFDLSIHLEHRAGILYDAFARRFAFDPVIGSFWQAMAADERRHENALLFTRNILKTTPAGADAVAINTERLRDLSALMDATLERTGSENFTIEEAVQAADRIESSEMDQVMETLTHLPPHPVIQRILDDMKQGTGAHDRRLYDFIRYLKKLP